MAEKVTKPAAVVGETANDRFKRDFGNWFWGSVGLATVVHFAIFAFFPSLSAEDVSIASHEIPTIELPPEVEIPPPPEQIARPATPVISDATIDEDITIAPTTFEAAPVTNLPPPPVGATQEDIAAAPVFTPFTVEPKLMNQPQVELALRQFYPPLLRDAGIGGRAVMWFFIDETGTVVKTQVNESSGYEALDAAASRVAAQMKFSPAKNRDKVVQVWVQIPITFTSK
jgi:TonB family protein